MIDPTPIRQAIDIASKRADVDPRKMDSTQRQARLDSIVTLADWGLFSNAQIADFTGALPRVVAGVTGKTDHTGGKLPVASLQPILAMIEASNNGEVDDSLTKAAKAAGASTRMIAKLVGVSQSTVQRAVRRAA